MSEQLDWVGDLAKKIIDQLSDGWGEEEDRRAAKEIEPILSDAYGELWEAMHKRKGAPND